MWQRYQGEPSQPYYKPTTSKLEPLLHSAWGSSNGLDREIVIICSC